MKATTGKKRKVEDENKERKPKKKSKATIECFVPEDLPQILVPLYKAAFEDPQKPWTDKELRLIAGNFLGKSVKSKIWNTREASLRTELLLMRPVDTAIPLLEEFGNNAEIFQSECECSDIFSIDRVVSADSLLPFVNKLQQREMKDWNQDDVLNLAHQLHGVQSIDFGISSGEAAGIWLGFTDVWENYLLNHPKLLALIDPVYVIIQVQPEAPVGPLPFLPEEAPMKSLMNLNGSQYAWTFSTQVHGAYWARQLRKFNPKWRVWMFTTLKPCIYF